MAKQAGEDEDWEEDDAEETALEGYSTIIDDDDNPVDEYQIFKAIFQSKDNCNMHNRAVLILLSDDLKMSHKMSCTEEAAGS